MLVKLFSSEFLTFFSGILSVGGVPFKRRIMREKELRERVSWSVEAPG